ncbi:MAG: carboxypeptidase regulatory-like domain-containing protein [Bryobacterales bacterium]|nr:carboxypeptidase regulatory-like domain-containing protein [Bryobacterales bacterium]
MRHIYKQAMIIACVLMFLGSSWMLAQSIMGSVSGRVVDPSGNVIVGAPVILRNERTSDVRNANTNELGAFTFPSVQPGVYTLRIEQQGFQSMERTGMNLSANERLALGDIALSIGAVTEKVTVQAVGETVQTASSDHSAELTSSQINMVLVRGRDVMSLLRTMPGVTYTSDTDAVGENLGTNFPNVQGGRYEWNTLNVDGLAGNDLGNPYTGSSSINLDAISDVKVLLNNYQAEYGRNGGAFINVVTKSGTQEFHGSAYWYKRHEMLNANNFFNNLNKVAKPVYRYNTLGVTIGGPVYIPGKFNSNKDKLFFFYSLEDWGSKSPRPLQQTTVPTALERSGNFSQTLDVSGALIPIRDPSAGTPFPGNIIPASRINKNGQVLLNVFPQPNALDRSVTRGAYNYNFAQSWEIPKRQHLFKIDYLPTGKDRFSVRGSTWRADNQGYGAPAGGRATWDEILSRYLFRYPSLVVNYTRTISPTMVNEFSGGVGYSKEQATPINDADLQKLNRTALGMTLKQFYPQNNPLNFIPMASFGGVPAAADIGWDGRFPMRGADTTFNFSDNFSWIRGTHAFKFGIFADRGREYEGEDGTFAGNFAFQRDINNPLDANYAYANAVLGNYYSYVESTSRPGYNGRSTILQWFAQDTWKVNRRLTLDIGFRFVWFTPWTQKNGTSAAFSVERYQASKAPALYYPALDSNGRRVARNPLTGELSIPPLIGVYVPNSGDPINGMVVGTDSTYPSGFKDQQPVQVEPRVGFAYDVFGNGKMAIRGSFGTFHNTRTVGGPPVVASKFNPPRQYNPTLYYGNMDSMQGASSYLSPPGTVYGFERASKTPTLYSYSFGVQRALGAGTVVDVSYVGNVTRHVLQIRNLNLVPYGARFLPQNADPTNPSTWLNDNYFRPYPGYGNINYYENGGTTNYNSMQVTLNRRFTKSLQFGLSYTWSKAMDFSTNEQATVSTYAPRRVWNYGKAAFDQTHNMVLNYIWDVPKLSKRWDNVGTRLVFDNWQVAGFTAFVSGQPSGVGFSTVDGAEITGGGDGARIVVTGKAPLSHGDRTMLRWFDTSVFQRTPRGSMGNAPKDVFRLPGINNWDISLFKNFPIKSEARYLQFRFEMYNAFNHTQFQSVDSTARFDVQGNQVNTRFGQVTAARAARVIQLSLRFAF